MSTPVSSNLFVDHSDLAQYSQVVGLNSFRTSGARQGVAQHFWSTENRPASSAVQETLEITLTSIRLVNWLQFDVARFPHQVIVEYADPDTGEWLPLRDAINRAPVTQAVLYSVPTQLPNASAIPGHLHPQHSFVGHWESLHIDTQPTFLQKLRLILQRVDNGNGPVDSVGNPADYSLAVRDFVLGYTVASREDIPRTLSSTADSTYTQPFGSTNDLLGSSVDFALRETVAARIMDNTPNDADTIWRCEPQPYPNAVVSFYADVRTADGSPQVTDQIYIDPVNNGAHVTLYYSNDEPVGDFNSPAVALDRTQAKPTGNVALADGRLQFGQYGDVSYLTIPNVSPDGSDPSLRVPTPLSYDPSLPWWFGVTVRPGFNQGVDSNEHPIIDCGSWRLSLTTSGVELRLSTSDVFVLPLVYQGGQDTSIVVGYTNSGDNGVIHFRARNSGDDQRLEQLVSVPIPKVAIPNITIGADLTGTYLLNSDILHLVLKEEVPDVLIDDFLNQPASYCTVAVFAADDLPQTRSALLRLDPTATQLIDADRPWALFGGPADKYEQMVWTPVPRDYVMQRGVMRFSPVKARFWKLEITNLQPVYHDVLEPTPQIVKTFPLDVLNEHYAQINRASAPPQLGASTQASLVGVSPYVDLPTNVSTGGTGTGYTNAEVYVANDYISAQRLRTAQGENWAYQTWHSDLSAPRFSTAQVHNYTQEVVTRTSKIAYQSGLRQLSFGRSSFSTQQDTAMYEDLFFDDQNLQPGTNFVYDATKEALTSGDSTKAVVTSVVFPSQRNLRGLQFAASQSQPVQLLPDDEFADPQHLSWQEVGDAKISGGVVQSNVLGTMLPLARNLTLGYWGDVAPVYPAWGDLVTSHVTYGQLRQVNGRGQTEGGIESQSVSQPSGGRLYASARVVADHDLASPLWVQIVDAVNERVLSEASAVVKRDQVTEWFCSYTVGEGGVVTRNTWGDVDGANHALHETFSDNFTRADSTVLNQMNTGQFWTSLPSSLHIVGNKATVTTAGQSNVINPGTPWGTMSVIMGNTVTTGTASSSVPLLQLGSYQLMNDGRIVDTNTARAVATIAGLTTGDTLTFVFKPTSTLTAPETPVGIDPTVQSWAFTVSRNGTYQTTVATTRAFLAQVGLAGAVGQEFTNFSWTPGTASVPVGEFIVKQPMPSDGVLAADSASWIQGNGRVWNVTQPVTFSTDATWQGSANKMQSDGGYTGISTNTGQLYGTFSFTINQLAATVPTTDYNVALLDQTNANTYLALRADGSLVSISGSTTTVLAAGIVPSMTAGDISIKYAATSTLSTAFKSTHSIPAGNSQALIFLSNDVVVGVHSGNNVWGTGWRGVTGYSDGTNFTITTGAAWSPDASNVYTDTTLVTWGQVSANGTRLWGDLVSNAATNVNPVKVRVVQKAASVDSWFMDTLSMFSDPIVWEFSHDAGHTWTPAFDVRNDPSAVLLFPPVNVSDPLSVGNRLCYRITAWGPNAWISHLAIRPWYEGFMQSVPASLQGSISGPNVNTWDQYAPIDQDPRWQVWHLSVPREWWFAYRSIDNTPKFITPTVTENVVVL